MKDNSVPLIFWALFTISIAPSVMAEGNHKGGHSHDEQAKAGDHKHNEGAHWMSPKEASEKVNPIKSDHLSITRGTKMYVNYCSSCHGVKAMGDGPAATSLNPKPTNLKAMSGGHSDGDFAWKIANGKGAMPAWQGVLNENQIWDLVNFIQNLKNENKSQEANNHADHDHKKHSHPKKHSH